MKTAEELFDKHKMGVTLQYDSTQLEVLEYLDFEQALTEHDAEIKKKVDNIEWLMEKRDYDQVIEELLDLSTELRSKL